jgi:hypothetical protein
MSKTPTQSIEEPLKETARQFKYPPTPDVTETVWKRLEGGGRQRAERSRSIRMRSAWVITSLVILLMAVLFAVPGVRAEIVRFFQVGVVRIFPASPTETTFPSVPQIPLTATPVSDLPSVTPYGPSHEVTITNIAGETTLAEARARASFPLRLPAYPANLGNPERIFLQENGLMVILVWSDPVDPDKAYLSLHEIASESILVGKFQPRVILETQVNGEYAIWAEGPYLVQLTSGAIDFRRIVEGNTLIWEENGITYRLESALSLEDTIIIAESLE